MVRVERLDATEVRFEIRPIEIVPRGRRQPRQPAAPARRQYVQDLIGLEGVDTNEAEVTDLDAAWPRLGLAAG